MFDDFFEDLKNNIRMFRVPPEIRQNFEAFLSKMGASTRKTVAVSFSQNAGLEMIEVDNLAGKITKYATRPLNYDAINRRMESYTEFAKALNELFEEFDISSNSNVILSLPNIHFGLMEVPQILHGDTVKNVILSEVEQSYIFKSNEPIVTWYNLTRGRRRQKDKPNTVLYTAIQKDVIENIQEVCQVVGCRFLTIETSHLSILRGLSFLGMTVDQVREDSIWHLIIIDANVFSIITLKGATPIKYFEEPLAMKSFEEDEIYKAIASSANEYIENSKLNHKDLMIISQTDFVNADVLKMEFSAKQHITVLNCNKYSQLVLYPTAYEIDPETAEQISLTAIGASAFLFYNYPIYLNYIKESVEERENIDDQIGNIKVNLGNIELNITRSTIRRLAMIFAGIMLVPLFIVQLILGTFVLPKELAKSTALSSSIESINNQIKALTETNQSTQFDINTAAKKTVEKNKSLLFQYSALSEVIPKNLWVTHSEDNEQYFYVSGISPSTRTIYEFYKNLKSIMNNKELFINKLDVVNDSLGKYINTKSNKISTLYNFEIGSVKNLTKTNSIQANFQLNEVEEKAEDKQSDAADIVMPTLAPPKIQAETNIIPTKKIETNNNNNNSSNQLPANLKKIEDIGN